MSETSTIAAPIEGDAMAKKRVPTLRELRDRQELTQMQLAAELGCHVRLVGSWEAGEKIPSGRYALRLVDLLGVSASELLASLEKTEEAARE